MPDSEMTTNLYLFARGEQEASPVKPEALLVERICHGDDEAFSEFYRMFAPMVHGIVLARVSRNDVDDIIQEVFISAYRNFSSLRDKNAVGGWLAMIARNRATEFFRQSKPTEELAEDVSQNGSSLARAHEILSAIRCCPDAYRETLVLRLVEGMTGPEIAERTGLTPESVRVNLHRGMKLLREKLGIGVRS